MRYENTNEKNGQMAEGQNPNVYLETMEDAKEQRKSAGEIRVPKMGSTQICQLAQGMYGHRNESHNDKSSSEKNPGFKRSVIPNRPLPTST